MVHAAEGGRGIKPRHFLGGDASSRQTLGVAHTPVGVPDGKLTISRPDPVRIAPATVGRPRRANYRWDLLGSPGAAKASVAIMEEAIGRFRRTVGV